MAARRDLVTRANSLTHIDTLAEQQHRHNYVDVNVVRTALKENNCKKFYVSCLDAKKLINFLTICSSDNRNIYHKYEKLIKYLYSNREEQELDLLRYVIIPCYINISVYWQNIISKKYHKGRISEYNIDKNEYTCTYYEDKHHAIINSVKESITNSSFLNKKLQNSDTKPKSQNIGASELCIKSANQLNHLFARVSGKLIGEIKKDDVCVLPPGAERDSLGPSDFLRGRARFSGAERDSPRPSELLRARGSSHSSQANLMISPTQ